MRPDFGLLILRVFIGGMLAYFGLQKFLGGEETLRWVGSQIELIGIPAPKDSVFPFFWGIMAAGSELLGGILVLVGFLFRPAAAMLTFTMLVATLAKMQSTDGGLSEFGFPLLNMVVFFALIWTGPGKFSAQKEVVGV